MKQLSLASSGFEKFGRVTKRSVFLAEMNATGGLHLLHAGFECVAGGGPELLVANYGTTGVYLMMWSAACSAFSR